MTSSNIHYLIGWIGAVIIIVSALTAWVLHAKYAYEQDGEEES